jgi:pre-rRNA-processing protein TSR3
MTAGDGMEALDVLILRDARESAKKCSLTPLRGMDGVRFVNYHQDQTLDAGGRVLLDPAGELLTEADAGLGLFLIDCSWRRLASIGKAVVGEPVRRRLPLLKTAYPRKSTTFEDPAAGLASVEALYAAAFFLWGPRLELLEQYRWAEEFLALNPELKVGGSVQ